MVTQTSKQAYKEINEEGVSYTQKQNIMKVVTEHYNIHSKGMSLREICAITEYEINAVSGRVNDLKKDGKLTTFDKKKCPYSKRTVNAIVPVDEVDGMQKDAEGKIKLLLTLYGYKDIEFRTHEFKRSLVVGYFEPIAKGDIARVSNNTLNILEEMSVWDDDAGRKYWYIIKDQEL
jgi:glutaredoxin